MSQRTIRTAHMPSVALTSTARAVITNAGAGVQKWTDTVS